MNEMMVCRACYHARRPPEDNDSLCPRCFACCWLLVTADIDDFKDIIHPWNDTVAAKHLLRVLRRVKAGNRDRMARR
jgi:hypothetical protein